MEAYPYGALASFIAAVIGSLVLTVVVLCKYTEKGKRWGSFKQWFNDENSMVKFLLLVATFVAIWIAARTTGFFLRALLDESFTYSALNVLDVVASLLTKNLCMTLLKSTKTEQIANAAMQSILIAVLVFLPRATSNLTRSIYGDYGGATIMLGFSAILISITYVLKFLKKESNKSEEEAVSV